MTTAADITCENSPGLLRVFFHGCEKSCERRPGYEANCHLAAFTGVHYKLGQIFPDSISTDSFFGLRGGLSVNVDVPAKGEGQEHSNVLPSSLTARDCHSEGPLQSDQPNDSSIPGSPPSSPVLPQSPKGEELGICSSPVLRGSSCSRYTSTRRAAVVVSVYGGLERESNPSTKATVDNRVRCFPTGLGSPLWQHFYRRSVVTGGMLHAHKLSGAHGSFIGSKNLCQRQGGSAYTTSHGQHDGHFICESNGGNPLTQPLSNSQQSVAVVSTTENNVISRAPSRIPERIGRRRVTYSPLVSRMEATREGLPTNPGLDGAMPGRPICYAPKPPTSTVRELETRSSCNSDRCLRGEMVRYSGVCIPSILPSRQMSTQGDTGGMHNCANSTSVASTGMVPHPAEMPNRVSSSITETPTVVIRPVQQATPPISERAATASRMEGIRQCHTAAGISGRTSGLILAGWSKATNTAYQSSWGRWNCWCVERGIDPFSCHVSEFLDFLAGLYEEGLEHRTINSIRSAVSMIHCHVEGIPFGQHPLVTRLLKGVYNSRPPRPRYSATWNVNSVLHILGRG